MSLELRRFFVVIIPLMIIAGAISPFAYAGGGDAPQATETISKDAKAAPEAEKTEKATSNNWQGLYVGIHAGYGLGNAETSFNAWPSAEAAINLAPTKMNPHPSGVIGGGQLGFNWQRNLFVLGVETDFSGSGMRDSSTYNSITQNTGDSWSGTTTTHQNTNWFGTLRLRGGFTPFKKLFVYGTGGMAYGRVNYSANTDFRPQGTIEYPVSFTKTKVGWTAGGGMEYALTSNWSLKTEYLYYNLGNESKTGDPIPENPPFQIRYDWKTSASTVNVGLNYKF